MNFALITEERCRQTFAGCLIYNTGVVLLAQRAVGASRQRCVARSACVCHHYFTFYVQSTTEASIETTNITNLSAEPPRRLVKFISISELFTASVFMIQTWAW